MNDSEGQDEELLLEGGEIVAGRYRIEGILGEGGMGAVYEATQLNLGRPVALKLLLPRFTVQPEARQRFEREARVAAALHHPNAVAIYDFGADNDRLYLVMERLHGMTLREAQIEGDSVEMGLKEGLRIVASVCDVLVVAHGQGLVHRDLKPENIFLEKNQSGVERVVVVDFGLAFIEDQEDVGRMTREGVLSGTPEYISPEQVRSRAVGPQSDIYSLGCVLYEVITGTVPFIGSDSFETITHHVYSPPHRPSEVVPEKHIPRDLEALVLQMMEKTPSRRPLAEEVQERLADILQGLDRRERAREEAALEGRLSRMIPRSKVHAEGTTLQSFSDEETGHVAFYFIGPLEEQLRTAFKVNGLEPLVAENGELGRESEVVFAPDASHDLIHQLISQGFAVLTSSDPSDFEAMAELLTLGVDEVVPRPVRADEVARRIWRVIRKRRRTKR